MYTTVDIGIEVAMHIINGRNNTLRLLRRSTTIEVDKRPTVYLSTQYREIIAYA